MSTCVHSDKMLFRSSRTNPSTLSILLTDPKSRKVILVEHPLLPVYVKDMFARALFGNLQVCKQVFSERPLIHDNAV